MIRTLAWNRADDSTRGVFHAREVLENLPTKRVVVPPRDPDRRQGARKSVTGARNWRRKKR